MSDDYRRGYADALEAAAKLCEEIEPFLCVACIAAIRAKLVELEEE